MCFRLLANIWLILGRNSHLAYQIRYALEIVFIPDGAGPMSVPSMQTLKLGTLEFSDLTTRIPATTGQATGYINVPGGDTPTQGNFNTALNGAAGTPTAPSMANDLAVAIAANLARIQGFATGGG
jgi:hypothetical protein